MALTLERAQRRLYRLKTMTWWAIAYGFLVMGLGGAYGVWGLGQVARGEPAAWRQGFDKPVVRIGMIFVGYADNLRQQKVTTPLEEHLRDQLVALTEQVGALAVMLLRLLLTSMCLTAGVIALTSGLTRREMFLLWDRLQQDR